MKQTNDQIILKQIIAERCAESENELSISEYFEIYSASEILKNYDLTYDDIVYGTVGSGGDGGIDSVFIFLNGEIIKEDSVINSNQKKNHVELVLIQSKISESFNEDAIVKFRETSQDLLNLSNDLDDYQSRYNTELLDKIGMFRGLYTTLAKTFPKIEIRYYYVTQGNSVHKNVSGKVPKLKSDIIKMFGGSEFSFEFIGASQLLEMTRNIPSNSRTIEVAESPIGTSAGSYLCLVSLSKYFEFISDNGSLVRSIFESNVRDYQGSVLVNNAIRKTLENKDSENFWYLNNGVTIITPHAVLAGKQLTIEDPQIVNGLQTSYEIYQYFSQLNGCADDERAVLVRIISESDESARDRIIRATNSQTSIPPASLRSSDEIHRNIEDFLKPNGFFYDRKKNFYKNSGMPVSKIISIAYMAQAMMAIVLLKPDSARARPSTIINSDIEYKKIFCLDKPIGIYLKTIQIIKQVESYLRAENCDLVLDRKTITNIKFYIAMMTGIFMAGGLVDIEKNIAKLDSVYVPRDILDNSLQKVLLVFNELGADDQVAKGPELVKRLLELDF